MPQYHPTQYALAIVAALAGMLNVSGMANAQNTSTSSGQSFPTRPIRIIAPYVPGGGVDFVARVIATKLSESIGQQVIVENRPGGGTNIGSELVARSVPD